MLGVLNDDQIKHLLQSQVIGRIGCADEDRIYVVPITYAYHEGYLYCHSKEGKKIELMRKNPEVCFEVDSMENMANWRSAIVWGTFEEITDSEAQEQAMKILVDRVMPMITSETVKPTSHIQLPHPIEKHTKAIPFRIHINEQTGRFEKTS